jgi:hypothetical protein
MNQTLSATKSRDNAQVYLGLPHLGAFGAHDDVARQGKLETSTKGKSMHCSYNRHCTPFNSPGSALAKFCVISDSTRPQLGHSTDISSCHERLWSASADHHYSNRTIAAYRLKLIK